MAELKYNWGTVIATDEGGDAILKISSAYDIIYRDGSEVQFKWGIRFETIEGMGNTKNSIVMRYDYGDGEKNVYAVYSPNKNGWIPDHRTPVYVSSDSPNNAGYYPNEHLYSTSTWHADSYEAGFFTVRVGVAWDKAIPTASRYTYEFKVPYPAAREYTIRYYANGGTGGPVSQIKYQGYSKALTSTKPTRPGYVFKEWNTEPDGSGVPYWPNEVVYNDYDLTLYAQWTATTPIFTPPTLSATETTISWGNFSINMNCDVYYSLDNTTNWVYLGSGSYGFLGSISNLSANSYHTIYFKAINAIDSTQMTINNVGISTYSYPYITDLAFSPIEAGSTQTISIYNPLGRNVTLKIAAVEDYDDNSIYKSGTFGSTTTRSTSGSFTVPIQSIAEVVKNNWRARVYYQLKYNDVERSGKWAIVEFPSSIAPILDTNILWNYFFRYEDCAMETINGEERPVSDFTGSSRLLLRSHSKFRYYLNSDYVPTTAFYGATANTYYVTLNDNAMTYASLKTYYYENSNGASTTNSEDAVIIPDSTIYRVSITVVDSRGMSATSSLSIGTSSMQAPTPTITSITRNDGYGTKVTLKLSGAWCSNMYGEQVGKYLRFYYRAVGNSAWSSYYLYDNRDGSIGYRSLAGTYSLDDISFDSGTAYEVRVLAYNGLSWGSYSAIETLSLGTPLLFLDEYQDGVGINCFPTGKGLSVDGFGHFTGDITANNISASGYLVASSYLETLSNLYASGDAYITGNIYRNGYLSLDTGNIGSYIGNYALPLSGGNMSGTINFTNAVSNKKSAIIWHDWPEGQHDNYKAGIGYDTNGGEAITFWTKQSEGALKLMSGVDLENFPSGSSSSNTPSFEASQSGIKKKGQNVPAVFIQSETPTATQVGDIWFII